MNRPDVAVVQDQFLKTVEVREGDVALVGACGPEVVEVVVRQVESLQAPRHQAQCRGGDDGQAVLGDVYKCHL